MVARLAKPEAARPIALVAFIDRSGGREQLLLGRKLRGFGQGKIVLPGGKVEAGGGLVDAAIREFREETGLDVAPKDLELSAQINFRFSALESANMDCATFITRSALGEPSISEELEPLWVDPLELPTMQMWPDAQHWLPRLVAGEKFTATIVIDTDNVSMKNLKLDPWA